MTNELFSSCKYEDESTGEPGLLSERPKLLLKPGDLERGDRLDFTAELGISTSLKARGTRLAGEPGSEEPR